MSIKEKHICRLCLKVAENEFVIDEIVKQTLEILLLKVDLDITRYPIICQDCIVFAKKCLYFKLTCIHIEHVIFSCIADKIEAKHNINVIYEQWVQIPTVFHDNFKICRFCMTEFECNNFVSLDTFRIGSTFEITQFMTEMDFSTIENPLICANCRENLENYFKFILNCLESEAKLTAYCNEKGIYSMGQVKLDDVLQCISTDILEYPDKCSQPCKIEQNQSECEYPETYIELIKHEELDIKNEKMNWKEKSFRSAFEMNLAKQDYDVGTNLGMTYSKTWGHNNDGHIYQKNARANIKEDSLINDDFLDVKSREISDVGLHGSATCTDETERTENVNRDIIMNNLFDPQSCTSLDRGVPKIKMHKCSFCAYETKRKSNLTTHTLVHRDVSEIEMYKCSVCTFESKHKRSFANHKLLHTNVSEIKMEKCSLCDFTSKYRSYLRNHMLVHKNVSEIKMQKCSLCDFESKHKCSLRRHMLVHKSVSEIKMKKCSLCAFESKHESRLRYHMLVHKDVSELKMYKCSVCAYKAKQNYNLTRHMLIHKNVSSIKMHKCSLCDYESKHKCSLTKHMLRHKNVSECKM